MTTGDLGGDLTKAVPLGYDQIQRLVLAAESLAEDQEALDPEFAETLRTDAEHLHDAATAGTVGVDGNDAPVTVGFSAALDD